MRQGDRQCRGSFGLYLGVKAGKAKPRNRNRYLKVEGAELGSRNRQIKGRSLQLQTRNPHLDRATAHLNARHPKRDLRSGSFELRRRQFPLRLHGNRFRKRSPGDRHGQEFFGPIHIGPHAARKRLQFSDFGFPEAASHGRKYGDDADPIRFLTLHGNHLAEHRNDDDRAHPQPLAGRGIESRIGLGVVTVLGAAGRQTRLGDSGRRIQQGGDFGSGRASDRATDHFASGHQGNRGSGGIGRQTSLLHDLIDHELERQIDDRSGAASSRRPEPRRRQSPGMRFTEGGRGQRISPAGQSVKS